MSEHAYPEDLPALIESSDVEDLPAEVDLTVEENAPRVVNLDKLDAKNRASRTAVQSAIAVLIVGAVTAVSEFLTKTPISESGALMPEYWLALGSAVGVGVVTTFASWIQRRMGR